MGRNNTPLEDLIEHVPWWVNSIIAFVLLLLGLAGRASEDYVFMILGTAALFGAGLIALFAVPLSAFLALQAQRPEVLPKAG